MSPRVFEELKRVWAKPDDLHEEANVMRLMPEAEAAAVTADLRSSWLRLDEALVTAWTDDNSNYAAVYITGRLSSRVVLIDHEEPEATPRYFTVESFQRARSNAAAAGVAWYEMEHDYPAVASGDYCHAEADAALAEQFLREYFAAPDESTQLGLNAIALAPPAATASLLPLLSSRDFWVQERACEVLGLRRCEFAVDALYEVALSGHQNARIASIRALKRIGSPGAGSRLALLRKILPDGFGLYLR